MTFFALSERQETGFDHFLRSMSAKILAWDVVLGKEAMWDICTYIHLPYICMTEVWDAVLSLKRSRNAGSGPPSRPLVTLTLTLMLLLLLLLQFVLHYLLLLVFLSIADEIPCFRRRQWK